jgi:hypothetical protein
MAFTARVPDGVTSVTLSVSGVCAVASKLITVTTAAELSQLVYPYTQPIIKTVNPATGAVTLQMATCITSLTVNGNVYAVAAGVSASMLAVDANAVLQQFNGGSFTIATGV